MALKQLITNSCQKLLSDKIVCHASRYLHTSSITYGLIYGKKDIEVLDEIIQNAKLDKLDWNNIKESVITNTRRINSSNIDSILIQRIINSEKFDVGKNYLDYLYKSGVEVNLGTLGNILKFYYRYGMTGLLTDNEKQHIYEIYDNVTKKYPVMDPITITSCILGLSVTPQWKECIKLLHQLKETTVPGTAVYENIIVNSFMAGDEKIGWELLQNMVDDNKIPRDIVYKSWIEFCVNKYKKKKFLEAMEKMFKFLLNNDLIIGKEAADLLQEVYPKKVGWKSGIVKIDASGKCDCCKQSLERISLNNNEYEHLREVFYKNVIVGKNIFFKTSPKEISQFLDFLKNTGPYTMILDGLNIMHSSADKSPMTQIRILHAVINYLLKQNHKILVLGRKHLEKLIKSKLSKAELSQIEIFYTQDLSYDDPFLLLAALSSQNCKFMSKDLMRGHQFLLKDEKLRILFKKWQQSNQYMLITVTQYGKVICKDPLKYLQSPQKSDDGWHIPISNDINSKEKYIISSNWLCLLPNNDINK